MIKAILIFNILSLFSISLFAQQINEAEFNKLISNKRVAYFDDAKKKYFGCGLNVHCTGLPVFFNNISFDKKSKRLALSGFVNPNIQEGDTHGTNIFRIFIAKPVKGKLTHIRLLAEVEDTIKSISNSTRVDLRRLSFETNFPFSKGDCLYIESTQLFRLKEYNISSLLK